MTDKTAWKVAAPRPFVDQRSRLTRANGLVRQNVRAYHAVIVCNGENGRPVYDACPHAHNKITAARKCAERAAARRNRGSA